MGKQIVRRGGEIMTHLQKINGGKADEPLYDDVGIGDSIMFKMFDSKVLARIVSMTFIRGKTLIVYQIYGTNSIGVLNLKKTKIQKIEPLPF